jgi:geranylgeranyl reductase family protein
MREKQDVVVVGAGPAGAACGTILADRGVQTLVLDRARFPRSKACAGGLSPGARASLEELGAWDDVVLQTQHVDSIRLESERAIPVTVRGAAEGFVINRRTLDGLLFDRLRATDAEVREGVTVSGVSPTSGGALVKARGPGGPIEIEARWVVVAAGAAWRRRMERRSRRFIHSMMARYRGVDHDRHAIELQFTDELYPLYGWVFPEPGGVCNVGIGIESDRIAGRPLGDLFRSFVDTRLGSRMDGATMIGRPSGFPIMAAAWPGEAGEPGILLAGEAARLVNPVTGEGISPALRSGILAARSIEPNLHDGAGPERCVALYGASLRREVGPSLLVGEALRSLGVRFLDWVFEYRHYLRGGRRILAFVANV